MHSNKEILFIKTGPYPDKVLNEGDTLEIGAQIHSFYWKKEIHKNDDYEPVAILPAKRCGLSRYHFRGLIVWKDYVSINNKPVASFAMGWHTPILCSEHKATYSRPPSFLDNLKLIGYLLPKIRHMGLNIEKYELRGYNENIVDEKVPVQRRFRWLDLNYYVLVAPEPTLDQLPHKISTEIKRFLKNVKHHIENAPNTA